MVTKVGINGFGRIGRRIYRASLNNPNIEVVAINDLTDAKTLAHLLKYDSIHGKLEEEVTMHDDETIVVGDRKVRVTAESEPANLKWEEMGIDVVIESTGRFTSREGALFHIKAGAKKVIISAPAKEEDITIVMGVNNEKYEPNKHKIVSNASCTTNCLAPLAKVIDHHFGIRRGMMTTVHSYTNDQRVLDSPHKDYRRARAAAENIIPTTTGAAKAVALVLPTLEGKLTGSAIRVPSANVSLVDFVVELENDVTVAEVNRVLNEAAEGSLNGILAYNEEPLVSSDYVGNRHSSIVDGLSTMVLDKKMAKIVAWYDNETAYSFRVIDLVEYMIKQGL